MKTKCMENLFTLLVVICTVQSVLAQPTLPPDTNAPPDGSQTNFPAFPSAPPPLLGTLGSEALLVATIPATPDPTQAFPSWATIYSSGNIIDTTNDEIIDTNA